MVETILLLNIALLLIVAKIFGEIAERLKISAMVGEVVAGLMLGPILLVVMPNEFLEQLASFGILFLLFLIGLSTHYEQVKKDIYTGSFLAISGTMLSLVFGFVAGWLIFDSIEVGIFIGIAILSTSTAITIRSLIDAGELHTRVYEMALAIDMADEVIAILALSLLTTFFTLGGVQIGEIVALFFIILGLIVVIMSAGAKIVGRTLSLVQKMRDEQILVAVPLVIVFLVAFISESVGVAGVTGAFLAGMMLSQSHLTKPSILPKMKTLGYGFFIPLFFAYSAVILDLSALIEFWWLILLLVVLGIAAKAFGVGFVSRYYGLRGREQRLLAASMIPRGEYSIVIAQIALSAAIITATLYTIIIAFVIITILITPIILRILKSSY